MDLVPSWLPVVATVGTSADGRAWLADLPGVIRQLADEWELELGAPYDGGSCSWVAPVRRPGGSDAVLKVSWPHREAVGEATALRWWAGRDAVELYRADQQRFALLIERCEPGATLGSADDIDAEERLAIGARLLASLWRTNQPAPTDLEQLADVTAEWADLVEDRMERLRPDFDAGLVARGVDLLRSLPKSSGREVVLHGDFNPGNILSARRRPWLVIDTKPMIGDPAYDPWPLIEQVDDPFAYPKPEVVLRDRFQVVAEIIDEPVDRLQAWTIARRVETALWATAEGHDGTAGIMTEARIVANLLGL